MQSAQSTARRTCGQHFRIMARVVRSWYIITATIRLNNEEVFGNRDDES